VISGGKGTGKVTLNSVTPAGGAVVSLSSNKAALDVPATITVPAGSTNASFTATADYVTASTPVTVTATFSSVSMTVSTSVLPTTISGLTITPSPLTGGNNATGKINLSGAAPTGGYTILLTSTNEGIVDVPATIIVGRGATSASLSILSSNVPSTATVTVTATLNSNTKSTVVSVIPVTLSKLTVTPSSTVGGQSQLTGFAVLTGEAPEGGMTVQLSSNSTVGIPDASVFVPEGATQASFGVTTV
jgi:hypothetical protein